MQIAIVIMGLVIAGMGFLLFKLNNSQKEAESALEGEKQRTVDLEEKYEQVRKEMEEHPVTRASLKEEEFRAATRGMLNQDVGAVLVLSKDDDIVFYNNEFEMLFPEIANLTNVSEQTQIMKLFTEEEYVSYELSKIYEIRSEKMNEDNFQGKFIWLVDITGHYKTNKKLQELKEMADAANKAKSNFLANMSHEIRTPINTVLGMDEIILRETTEVPIQGYAENIREAGTTLLSLVNDLLDFSKIECGKMEILQVEYEVANLLTEVINMIEIKAVNKHLEFIPVVSEDIPYLLFGDEIRIKQIMINLLTNAVKYTKEGSVVFKVDWKEAGDSSIDLIVSVTDTGIGIQKEDIDRLFVSFERIEEEKNRNIEGSGLGLSITKQLLELMGSSLSVRSDYGVGSTFSFVLRQGIRDRKPIGKFREKYAYKKEKYKQFRTTFVAPDAKLLIVDDNGMNLSVVEGLLKNTQIQVDKAISGEKAIAFCKEKEYDLVLMDHMMPYMDGIEALKHIREEEDSKNKETPVIVLTANAVAGAKDMYLKEGFIDYMSKPIQGKRLEEKILNYLPQKKYVLVEYDEIEKDFYRNLWKEVSDEIRSEYEFEQIDIPSAVESAEGDKECFRFLLESFRDNENKNRDDIQNAFETKDYENYTIFVHALKSTAKMIGAEQLSEEARALETAGKEKNISYINANHEETMILYKKVVDEIKNYFKAIENQPQEQKQK